eukprot:Mrub_02982.p3 GENE.Mrub_02982~~Mrub_02982.p3  ORF type:complete len:165 (-),score=6.53 Mrub_02982:874-1368(-)
MLGTLSSAVLMAWAGQVVDTVGLRASATLVCLAMGISCYSMHWVDNPVSLFLWYFMMRFTGQASSRHSRPARVSYSCLSSNGNQLLKHALGRQPCVFVLVVLYDAIHRSGVHDVAWFHCNYLVVDSYEGNCDWYQWEYSIHVHDRSISSVDDALDQYLWSCLYI